MVKSKSVTATARLKHDYARLMKDPVPYVLAAPLSSNILEWHYVVRGAPNSPYEGGAYHGKLVFPPDFPFKPPSIYMITPNGRFQTNTRLCLSISDYHPDTWNPAWTVSTILTGLLSFMNETAPTLGSVQTSDYEKRVLAKRSRAWNLKDKIFCELFFDLAEELRVELANEEALISAANPGAVNAVAAPPTEQDTGVWYNALILIGVALVAFSVHYVLRHSGVDDSSS